MKVKPPPLRRTLEGLQVWLVRAATENVGMKLMSFALAVFIWAWLQSEQVVEQRARVRVQYAWPEGLVQVDEVPRTVSLTVSGPQGRVRALKRSQLTMSVDLSGAKQGPTAIDFTDRAVAGLPENITISNITPPSVDVQLDARIRRTVRVRPAVIGEPAEGWTLGAVSVEPESVELVGPESVLADLGEISTELVNISNKQIAQEVSVPVALPKKSVQVSDGTPVTVRVAIDPVLTDRTFTNVAVLEPTGWSVDPKAVRFVTLEGPVGELAALREDRIDVVVRADSTAGRTEHMVRWRRNDPSPVVEVFHSGKSDQIRVVELSPDRFTLIPEE